MLRDVAGDKWDSCRAIDCARRTDRLALMRFVVFLLLLRACHLPRNHSDIEEISSGTGTTSTNDLEGTGGSYRYQRFQRAGELREPGISRRTLFQRLPESYLRGREKRVISDKSVPVVYACCPTSGRTQLLGRKILVELQCIGGREETLVAAESRCIIILDFSIFPYFRATPFTILRDEEKDGDSGTTRGSCRYSVLVSVRYPL